MAPCTLDTGFSWAEKEAYLYLPAPITVVPLPLNPHPPLHCDTLSPWPSGSLLVNHVDPASSAPSPPLSFSEVRAAHTVQGQGGGWDLLWTRLEAST